MHIPVLLQEILNILQPKPGEFFVDGTLGAGGHAREILERIQPGGKFLAVDRDLSAVEDFKDKLTGVYYALEDIQILHASYAQIPRLIAQNSMGKVDGILLDLGFSSEQITGSLKGRGFSFDSNEPLIMTYSTDDAPLATLLEQMSTEQITEIIRDYSDERYAARIADAIVRRVRERAMQTSADLSAAVKSAVPKNYEHGRIHPATRTFMAMRMHVNHELEHLELFLKSLPNLLNQGAHAAIISFHSKEDRLVKNYFREYAKEPNLQIDLITKKPITAASEEISRNPRSRSAKLRAIKAQ